MSDSQDHEWLRAREAGEAIDDVPAGTRAKYEQLQSLIVDLPGEAPSAGWKQRVLASLDQAVEPPVQRPPIRRLRRWIGSAAVAAAAVVLVVVFMRRGSPGPSEPTLTTEVRTGGSQHRGGDVSIGDTLIVKAASNAPAELRVYGGSGEPLARCGVAGDAGCSVERDGERRRFRVEVLLRAPGAVRSVLFVGPAIAPPGETLADDLAAAARDKTATLTATPIVVQ